MNSASTTSSLQQPGANRFRFPVESAARRSRLPRAHWRALGLLIVVPALALALTMWRSGHLEGGADPASQPAAAAVAAPALIGEAAPGVSPPARRVEWRPPAAEFEPSAPLASQAGGTVYLQVAASYSGERFDALIARLSSIGFDASAVGGADGLTRVVVGPYLDREQAQAPAGALRDLGFKPFPREL